MTITTLKMFGLVSFGMMWAFIGVSTIIDGDWIFGIVWVLLASILIGMGIREWRKAEERWHVATLARIRDRQMIDERTEGTCHVRADGLHCNCWWDNSEPCCNCRFTS